METQVQLTKFGSEMQNLFENEFILCVGSFSPHIILTLRSIGATEQFHIPITAGTGSA